MVEKQILIDLDDERAGKVAGILNSKAAKKILMALAEENLSESDISGKLKMPLNTVEYNLKNLIDVGLVEKTSDFFWSSRGKKIPVYKAARKKIVISPRSSGILKGVVGAILISGIAALILKIQGIGNVVVNQGEDFAYAADSVSKGVELAPEISSGVGNMIPLIGQPVWLWFFAGALFALLIFLIINWRKI